MMIHISYTDIKYNLISAQIFIFYIYSILTDFFSIVVIAKLAVVNSCCLFFVRCLEQITLLLVIL